MIPALAICAFVLYNLCNDQAFRPGRLLRQQINHFCGTGNFCRYPFFISGSKEKR